MLHCIIQPSFCAVVNIQDRFPVTSRGFYNIRKGVTRTYRYLTLLVLSGYAQNQEGSSMLTILFVFELAISFDPVFTLEVLTALVGLVGKGAFAYYWMKRINKEA